MKTIKRLLVILILLSLFGCGSKNGTKTIKGEEFNIYDGILSPVALGEKILTDEELSNLDELEAPLKISTYIDAVRYIDVSDYDNSYECIKGTYEYFYGDYEDIGNLKVVDGVAYYLLVLKNNGKYYPIDLYGETKNEWLENYDLETISFDSIDEMCAAFKTISNNDVAYSSYCQEGYVKGTMPYELINGNKVVISSYNGMETCAVNDIQSFKVLGYPVLSDDEINELTNGNRAYYITTYIDALRYYINTKSRLAGFSLITDVAELLAGDYEEVGTLDILTSENCDYMLVLKKDGVYYVTDPNTQISNKTITYQYRFSDYTATDPEDFVSRVNDDNNNLTSRGYELSYRKLSGSDYVIEAPKETRKLELITGETVETEYRLGLEVFPYCGTQIPVGLGLPQLTYEQIDELIATKDYENTAKQIKTVADMCCYCLRAKIASQRNIGDTINVGGIVRDDGWTYTLSGKQLLQVKFANCTASASLANYLLKGDYDDMGYISMFYYGGDGHVINYVKKDGVYYLVNTDSQFLLGVEQGETALPNLWIKEFGAEDLPASEDLDELMIALVNSDNPCTPDVRVKDLFVIKSEGDYCIKWTNSNYDNNDLWIFPDTSEVMTYTDSEFDYGTPQYDYLSQTYMVDFEFPDDRPILKNNMG